MLLFPVTKAFIELSMTIKGFIDEFLISSFIEKLLIKSCRKNSISESLIIFIFLAKIFDVKNIKNKLIEIFIQLNLIIPPSSFFGFNFIFFRI